MQQADILMTSRSKLYQRSIVRIVAISTRSRLELQGGARVEEVRSMVSHQEEEGEGEDQDPEEP